MQAKIVTVIGARPQFIKAAALSRAVASRSELTEVLVHTGQHYDSNMSDVFFEEMAIPPPVYHLGVGGGPHGAMTGRQLEKIEEVLTTERPDLLLVYGDTNSTLAGALAAAKMHIPIAHVEAGLRSFNRQMPEEINRVLTDHLASMLFAPTESARTNLRAEGIAANMIHVVGDIMYDVALFYKEHAREPRWFERLGVLPNEYILCTIHRAENTDVAPRLRGIFDGLSRSARPVILPLHPRTRARVADLDVQLGANVHIVDPVGYLEMVWLEAHSFAIATDSGGVQKEAYFHGRPCITLRDETEWIELVDSGVNVLVGADARKIVDALENAKVVTTTSALYGDGAAAAKILDFLTRSK